MNYTVGHCDDMEDEDLNPFGEPEEDYDEGGEDTPIDIDRTPQEWWKRRSP